MATEPKDAELCEEPYLVVGFYGDGEQQTWSDWVRAETAKDAALKAMRENPGLSIVDVINCEMEPCGPFYVCHEPEGYDSAYDPKPTACAFCGDESEGWDVANACPKCGR